MTDQEEPEDSQFLNIPNQQEIENEIDRIVFQSDQPIVVAINGRWGEGKTYFWNKTIIPKYQTKQIIYVSVFGAISLDNIRERVIFEALRKPKWRNNEKLLLFLVCCHKITSRLGAVGTILRWLGEKFIGFLTRGPELIKAFLIPKSLSIQFFEEDLIKPGLIICFDDIERLSQAINIEDLLGYINELKDDRNVKIVLIYNQEKLGSNNKNFKIFQEKVIDKQLLFIPDVSENIERVFNSILIDKNNSSLLDHISEKCNLLGMKNIRLLKKVERYYQEIKAELHHDIGKELKESILYSLLLFVWVKYCSKDTKNISFEFLNDYNQIVGLMKAEKDDDPDLAWANKLLISFGYFSTDDLDLILMDFVISDVLDRKKLKEEYIKYRNKVSKGQLEEEFSTVWKHFYHGTLRDNEDEFCNALEKSTLKYLEYIPINSFDEALCKLDKLDREDIVQNLLGEFESLRSSSIGKFDQSSLFEPIKHEQLITLLNDAVAQNNIDERTIGEVIESALGVDFPSTRDMKKLTEFTEQEFVEYFTSKDQEALTTKLRALGDFAIKFNTSDGYGVKLGGIIRNSVKIIASQHRLNRLRMESMLLIDKTNTSSNN